MKTTLIMAAWLIVATLAMLLTAGHIEAGTPCEGPFVCSVQLDSSAVTDLR